MIKKQEMFALNLQTIPQTKNPTNVGFDKNNNYKLDYRGL